MHTIDSKILVQVMKEEAYTEKIGGFVVPSGSWKNSTNGTYVNSSDVSQLGTIIKPGDIIYIQRGSGYKFKNNDEEYRVISIPDVIVVLD